MSVSSTEQFNSPTSESVSKVDLMTRSRWTITRKLLVLIVPLTFLSFCTLTFFSASKIKSDSLNLVSQNYSEINSLLAQQSAGAVRWNKSDPVNALFTSKSSQVNSQLEALWVYSTRVGAESWFVEQKKEGWNSADAAEIDTLLQEHATSELKSSVTFQTEYHILTIAPIFSPKNSKFLGNIVTAWSTQDIQNSVATIIKELATITLVITLFLTISLGWVLARGVGVRIRRSVDIVNRIADGDYKQNIECNSRDELGELASALTSVQKSLLAGNDSEKKAAEFGRIKQALDCANSGTVLADENLNIVYVNRAAERVFGETEQAFRNAGSINFDASNLIGQSLEFLSRHADLSQADLNNLESSHSLEIEVSDKTLVIEISAVASDSGKTLGTVLQVKDRTKEVRAEIEMREMINAAGRGDFTHRIDASSMQGFYAQMAEMLNKMAEISNEGLSNILQVLKSFEVGNLSVNIEGEFDGIFSELKDTCNATALRLKDTVKQIRKTSADVKSGAAKITEGNKELFARTETQASGVRETTASIVSMKSIVQGSAEDANHAREIADQARSKAEEGGMVAKNAINAVGKISESSQKISSIIGVIDEIAFQTNLLALNAAVEAARAGDQGRGFGVVASEVGNLAGRSASAAKEIKSLIEDSVARVNEGERLVAESGALLEEIVTSVSEVTNIVSGIAQASNNQTEGIGKINASIDQIDQVTQQNAGLAKHVASASEAVDENAENLDKLIGFFNDKSIDVESQTNAHVTNMNTYRVQHG